jgi:hypothetical protein
MKDQWYEITGFWDPDSEKVVDLGDVRCIVKGSIDNVVVVQVPADLPPDNAHRLMRVTQETLKGGGKGADRPMVLMPDNIKLMRARKITQSEMDKIKKQQAAERVPKPAMH